MVLTGVDSVGAIMIPFCVDMVGDTSLCLAVCIHLSFLYLLCCRAANYIPMLPLGLKETKQVDFNTPLKVSVFPPPPLYSLVGASPWGTRCEYLALD